MRQIINEGMYYLGSCVYIMRSARSESLLYQVEFGVRVNDVLLRIFKNKEENQK